MTQMEKPATLSRRAVLMGTGALVVSVGAPVGLEMLTGLNQAFAQGTKPPLTPDQLSSYIAVNADGTLTAGDRSAVINPSIVDGSNFGTFETKPFGAIR